MTDAEWFRQSIETLFGDGGQSAFARFMVLSGDQRRYETILRTIQNTAAGRHRISGEMRCLLAVMMRPGGVKRMVREAVG